MTKRDIIDIVPVITSPSLYVVNIAGLDGILFNKMPDLSISKTEKKSQEKIDPLEKERLTWRDKLYTDESGQIIIPGENIHECLKEGAKYWGQKIPGEGNKSYTDVIASAVVCENMYLGLHRDDDKVIPFGKATNGNPSKGKKSGAKVYKIRPLIRPWGGEFKMHVFDARLTPSVLQTVISYAGMFRGLCDWRPTFGRFNLVSISKD